MVIWSLALALPLAGCSGGPMSQGEFEDRAREVAGRWHGSAADRAWREGFVPLEHPEAASDWKRLPAWANRSDHNGAWSLDVDLPAETPPARRLQWPDGSALTVPLVTAAQAYAEVSKPAGLIEDDCPPAGCRKLHVTGVELVDVPVRTNRGTVQVPAWRFTLKGLTARFVRIAVHPSAITPRPAAQGGGEHEEVTAFDPVPGRERELLLRYLHGACDRTYGARAYETRDLVVVDVDVEPTGDGPCPAIGKIDQVTVTLDAPLGDRLLLDAGGGLPVLPGVPASR
ncbi:hypothetical protein [Planomonospora alba]|uniref:hypothetical protein n=1 Tax=Planomonospora alba TaxID=161354 RepID=UPI0031EED4F5